MERVQQVEQKMNKSLWGHSVTLGPKVHNALQVEGPSTSSKYEGLEAAMAADLMIGFWFGIGAILANKMVSSLEELISRK